MYTALRLSSEALLCAAANAAVAGFAAISIVVLYERMRFDDDDDERFNDGEEHKQTTKHYRLMCPTECVLCRQSCSQRRDNDDRRQTVHPSVACLRRSARDARGGSSSAARATACDRWQPGTSERVSACPCRPLLHAVAQSDRCRKCDTRLCCRVRRIAKFKEQKLTRCKCWRTTLTSKQVGGEIRRDELVLTTVTEIVATSRAG